MHVFSFVHVNTSIKITETSCPWKNTAMHVFGFVRAKTSIKIKVYVMYIKVNGIVYAVYLAVHVLAFPRPSVLEKE